MNHEQHTLSKAQGLGDNKGSGRHACIYLQIMLRYPEAKLLLCAPQNYSADLLASALRKAGVTAADMLRLNDPRLPPNQVSIPPQHMSNIVSQDCWMPSCRSRSCCLIMFIVEVPHAMQQGKRQPRTGYIPASTWSPLHTLSSSALHALIGGHCSCR